jgi:hypothetical protein
MLGQRLLPRFGVNEFGAGSWLVMLDGSDVVGPAHEADPDAVREIPVLATYSDGAEVHSA